MEPEVIAGSAGPGELVAAETEYRSGIKSGGVSMKPAAIVVIGVLVLVLASGCTQLQQISRTPDQIDETPIITPTPTPVLSDEEKLQIAVINHLNKDLWGRDGWSATDKGVLSEEALKLAKSGEHSLKLIGKNSDEAFEVFKLYEKNCIKVEDSFAYCGVSSKDFGNYFDATRSEKRGIGVYRTNGQFNIAIVYMQSFPAETNTTASGAIQIVKKPDEVRYVW